MKKIELLAPAGNMECLRAAVMAGCDAVYLGGTLFGARAFAGNFTDEELKEAVNYCHLYDVKVYVTCNILIYEHEVEHFINYIRFLHQISVDAIIIQDLGMLDLVHQKFPNLELHASTQMHIHNLDGVIMAKKLGCKRVVLARETSIDTVKEIIKQTDVDIEIFAHGALCVSYSGQCLFSSLIGNRSGNRGSCVGSCRLPYEIVTKDNIPLNLGSYPLSMKDLNTLEYVGELIEANVTSLKIEGRMKSREYVYVVTKLYREAIDSYYQYHKVFIDNEKIDALKRIFSRGFTKGYLFNEKMDNIINDYRPNHLGVYIGKVISSNKKIIDILLTRDVHIGDGLRILLPNDDYGLILNEFKVKKKLVKKAFKNDVITIKVQKDIPLYSKVLLTKDVTLISTIDNIIDNNERKISMDIYIEAIINKPLKIKGIVNQNEIEVEGNIVIEAQKSPVTKDVLKEKISKINDSVYKINNIDIDLSPNIFIPMKEFNDLKHRLINKMNDIRLYQIPFIEKEYNRIVPMFNLNRKRSVLVNNYISKLDFDIIYSENLNDNCIIKLPKVIDSYDKYDSNKEYLVGELGAFNKLKNIYCDYSFNVTNSYTIALLHSLGAKTITLSLELSKTQIEKIINCYYNRYKTYPNLEKIILGYREVMCLKTNLNWLYQHDDLFLKDRFNNLYLIRQINNMSYIYENKLYQDNYNYYNIGVNILRENHEI